MTVSAAGGRRSSGRRVGVGHIGPERIGRGGMAAVLRELSRSPLAERYDIEFLTTYRHANGPLLRLVFFAWSLVRVAVWCLRPGPRVAHVHTAVRGSWYRKALVVALVRLLRRPVVLQVHSGAVDIAAFWQRIGPLRRRLIAYGMCSADQVLSVSQAGARTLSELLGVKDVMVVGNAAPRPLPATPGVRDEADGRMRVLYLGGFANPAKGGQVLLEALPSLIAGDDVQVIMAGPGELPPEGERLASENPAVEWVGWLDERAKADQLALADVVALPSISEGLPVALLESMVAGKAIVAARTGGMPEILTDGRDALLVEARDAPALAAALGALARDDGRRAALGAAAAERARRLNHDEVYAPLERLYDRLVGATPSGSEEDVGEERPRVLLVCSPGGHLQQMLALRPAWQDARVSWATLEGRDVEHILAGEDLHVGHGPTNRSLGKLLRNLFFAYRVLEQVRPDAILSTGAGLAVPFFVLGRLRGCRLVYVESLTRTEGLSLSGRMVAPFAHEQFVQWPGAMGGSTRYVGSILSTGDVPEPALDGDSNEIAARPAA